MIAEAPIKIISKEAHLVLDRMYNGEDLTDREQVWFVKEGGMQNWEVVPWEVYNELISSNFIKVRFRLFGGSVLEITPQGLEYLSRSSD